jgi:hypothetical protein
MLPLHETNQMEAEVTTLRGGSSTVVLIGAMWEIGEQSDPLAKVPLSGAA